MGDGMDGMNKEKWKAMTPKKKRQYIWGYYKFHIIITLLVLFLGGRWIYEIATNQPPVLTVTMFNVMESVDGSHSANFDEYLQKYGYENFENAVSCNTTLKIFTKEENADLFAASYVQHSNALYTWLQAGSEDVVIGRGEYFYRDLVESVVFMDLREVLPQELLEQYADSLVYCTPVPLGQPQESADPSKAYPCAIYLKDNAWIQGTGYYRECYVGIPKSAKHVDAAKNFLEYILTYEEP